MKTVQISKKSAVKSLLRHHPWVFSGALGNVPISDGEIVRLVDKGNNFLGIGYGSEGSSILVRILNFEDGEINEEYWTERFAGAFSLRKDLINFEETNCFRLINAEGDFLPGLIVDVYDKYAVVDFHVEGLRVFENEILDAIKNLGFEPISKAEKRIEVLENGYKFFASPGEGQKTGFFLDQRENRQRIQKYCEGKTVLNLFSYTGGFSIYALKAGAKSVVNVDSSEFAIEQAKENYKLNGLEIQEGEFIVSDAFEYLEKIRKQGMEFDIVVCDPPAFVKHKDAIKRALAGYRRLNSLAMSIISEGGILSTYSCSGHISNDDFRATVWQSAQDADKDIQMLENSHNQFDHPVDLKAREGEYLKGLFLRVS